MARDDNQFSHLDYREFELLVGLLLARQGFRIERTPEQGHSGADFVVTTPTGNTHFVEVKHFQKTPVFPVSLLERFLGDVERYRNQSQSSGGILAFSGILPERAREVLKKHPEIAIWDRQVLDELLGQHPDIWSALKPAISGRLDLEKRMSLLRAGTSSRPAQLIRDLQNLQKGKEGWQAFEDLGTRILIHIFGADLGPPDRHNRTEDGLEIMDAIFPIRSHHPPWSLVRSEFRSRFVVAEFKNYGGAIGQRQIESLAQYLYPKAQRLFGLLVSRCGPDESALAQRRKEWVSSDSKLIVFLDDDDLIAMLQMAEGEQEGNPFQIIDAQLEEFFRKLNP